jgi:hypothetical protein
MPTGKLMEIIGFGRLLRIIGHRLIESANRQFQRSAHFYMYVKFYHIWG